MLTLFCFSAAAANLFRFSWRNLDFDKKPLFHDWIIDPSHQGVHHSPGTPNTHHYLGLAGWRGCRDRLLDPWLSF
jgi:hypothetical protein